jgi:exodeoxyribonuclease V alpha subunit
MNGLSPRGTARERFLQDRAEPDAGSRAPAAIPGDEDFEPGYLGWEIARCAAGASAAEQAALAGLAAACVASIQSGSTRMPLSGAALAECLALVGAEAQAAAVCDLVARARNPTTAGPLSAVIGAPGERKPLLIDGDWLYAERMRALEDRLCQRVRARLVAGRADESKAVTRALAAVAAGPPDLTAHQKRAVREALSAPLALVAGGPGTGKTTTIVALLRALAWTGTPVESIGIAAPTGKAAQRLSEAIAAALAAAPRDLVGSPLQALADRPQTLHRLLGWSPASGRFARHANDPLPHRVLVVDEASMIDLVMMERLLASLRADARLVLFGDADQLPSVEAGAVFRDLCACLRPARLEANLRVTREAGGAAILEAARAVNAGSPAEVTAAVAPRDSIQQVTLQGAEHLGGRWAQIGGELLDFWWGRFGGGEGAAEGRMDRQYRFHDGAPDAQDERDLRALFDAHARARILCVTRVHGLATGAAEINDRLLARLRGGTSRGAFARRIAELPPGAPAMVQRNDYQRGLYNGDQGVVVRGDLGEGTAPRPVLVVPRGGGFRAFAIDPTLDLAPAFAMSVHKAQGSEFDHVALVLPDEDMPLLSRELLYTAITRARRSVLLVGAPELLARAVRRAVVRHSGLAERLAR